MRVCGSFSSLNLEIYIVYVVAQQSTGVGGYSSRRRNKICHWNAEWFDMAQASAHWLHARIADAIRRRPTRMRHVLWWSKVLKIMRCFCAFASHTQSSRVPRERPDDPLYMFLSLCWQPLSHSLAHSSAPKLILLLLFLRRVCFWRVFLSNSLIFLSFSSAFPRDIRFSFYWSGKAKGTHNTAARKSMRCSKRNADLVRPPKMKLSTPAAILGALRSLPTLSLALRYVWAKEMRGARVNHKNRWWHTTCIVVEQIIHFFLFRLFFAFSCAHVVCNTCSPASANAWAHQARPAK